MERFTIACSFRCISDNLSGHLWVCMVLIMKMTKNCFGMNWLAL
jgi:hypothetical protein